MLTVKKISIYMDELLSVPRIADYSNNGLQVEASQSIKKIAFAVDTSLENFKKAADGGADLLVVHHGLFWGQALLITGYVAERMRFLFENNLSLYAVHLPLDVHTELGNSVALAEAAGFTTCNWFAPEKGVNLGCLAAHPEGLPYETVLTNLQRILGSRPTTVIPDSFKGKLIKKVGTVTGGGMRFGLEAAELGADLYISGESSHAWYHPIMECGIPTILYGHYLSETLGIKRLMEHMSKEKGCETFYIDTPTNM